MKSLVKIEFKVNTPKEAVNKLKEIQEKILNGIRSDSDFEILIPEK